MRPAKHPRKADLASLSRCIEVLAGNAILRSDRMLLLLLPGRNPVVAGEMPHVAAGRRHAMGRHYLRTITNPI